MLVFVNSKIPAALYFAPPNSNLSLILFLHIHLKSVSSFPFSCYTYTIIHRRESIFNRFFEHPSVHESGNFCKYWAIPQFFQVLSIPYVKVASLDRKQTTALRFGWMPSFVFPERLFLRSHKLQPISQALHVCMHLVARANGMGMR